MQRSASDTLPKILNLRAFRDVSYLHTSLFICKFSRVILNLEARIYPSRYFVIIYLESLLNYFRRLKLSVMEDNLDTYL